MRQYLYVSELLTRDKTKYVTHSHKRLHLLLIVLQVVGVWSVTIFIGIFTFAVMLPAISFPYFPFQLLPYLFWLCPEYLYYFFVNLHFTNPESVVSLYQI